jgi:hypothetical protein
VEKLTKLIVIDGVYQLAKLPSPDLIPSEGLGYLFFSVTKTDDEISLIVSEDIDLPGAEIEKGWRIIKFADSMDLSLVGVAARITAVLADAGINLCMLSTYDTDWVLVKDDRLDHVVNALVANGYEFMNDVDGQQIVKKS